jgi:periplasmic protein CpxP/Spy
MRVANWVGCLSWDYSTLSMKIKSVVLLSSLVAIAFCSIAVLPAVSQTQSSQSQSAPAKQETRRSGKGLSNLNLNDAQKAQMKQIKDDSKAAIVNVLTPEQKATWQSLKQNRQNGQTGRKGEGGMKALNLSETQKAQIKQIRDDAKQKIQNMLTPEQRTQMQQNRQNFKMRRQGQ